MPLRLYILHTISNWWLWSPESWRFEDRDLYMYRPHEAGAFTRIPEDAAIIRKCKLN